MGELLVALPVEGKGRSGLEVGTRAGVGLCCGPTWQASVINAMVVRMASRAVPRLIKRLSNCAQAGLGGPYSSPYLS